MMRLLHYYLDNYEQLRNTRASVLPLLWYQKVPWMP